MMGTPLPVIIDQTLLDQVSVQARQSPRLRKNFNFHPTDEFCSHRLLNGMEPGSYIRPHRHQAPSKDESIMMIRGRIGLVVFDDGGNVTMTKILATGSEAVGVDIPHGCFHTLVSLAPGSIFFEAKAGPYLPLEPTETASWAPAEGDDRCRAYLATLESFFS